MLPYEEPIIIIYRGAKKFSNGWVLWDKLYVTRVSIPAQSQLSHTFCMVFFKKKSLFVLKLETIQVTFFSVCIAQYAAYGIWYPAYNKKRKKSKFKKRESVEKVLKVWGKSMKYKVQKIRLKIWWKH